MCVCVCVCALAQASGVTPAGPALSSEALAGLRGVHEGTGHCLCVCLCVCVCVCVKVRDCV